MSESSSLNPSNVSMAICVMDSCLRDLVAYRSSQAGDSGGPPGPPFALRSSEGSGRTLDAAGAGRDS